MKIKIFIITASLIMGLIMVSCKKDSATTTIPTPVTPTGLLEFHLHTNVDTNEVDNYGETYYLRSGRKITVEKAQLYISGIQLVKADGSTYDIANTYILKIQESEVYAIGNVPTGDYLSVRFYVGLDSAINKKIPVSTDSLLNKPEMWFGSTAQPDGYVFVNFQGTIDTSTVANGLNLTPFTYKIGTNLNRAHVSMPNEKFTVTANQTQFVHIIIDYNYLFNGLQLNDPNSLNVKTTLDNATSLSAKLVNNIPGMFSYEY